MSEIDEILKFDPGAAQATTPEDDEIAEILKFDPVGGTFQEPEAPPPGAPTPAQQFPEYPGAYRGYNEPTEPTASFGALAKSTLADDPLTKVKILARERGIPLRDIARNYRFAKGGEIEFKAASGKWQRETPEGTLGGVKGVAADIAGRPSTYLGVAGGIVGGPKGAIGGAMAGEVARKAAAKYFYDEPQTAWGNIFDVALEGLLALGGETLAKIMIGQTNKLKMRKSKALRFAGKEIKEGLLTPEDHAKALYIESLANKHGITLAPHQLYDREGMTNIWMYLRKHPLTSDAVQKFDTALEAQTDEAVEGFIKQMGGYDQTPFQMGEELRDTSGKAIKGLENARQSTAQPYYDAAFDRTPTIDIERLKAERANNLKNIEGRKIERIRNVKGMVDELQQTGYPFMKQKGESAADYKTRISTDYKRLTGKDTLYIDKSADIQNLKDLKSRNADIDRILKGDIPDDAYVPKKVFQVDASAAMDEVDRLLEGHVKSDPSYTALNRIKKMITQAEGDAEKLNNIKINGIDNVLQRTKTQRGLHREVKLIKDQLTGAMDDQIPDYSAARGIYGQFGMAPPIEEMKNSIIGQLSKMEGDDALEKAVHKIFGGKGPSAQKVAKARAVMMAEDPDIWRRAIGTYIKDVYFQLTVTEGGSVINSAGKMHKLLFGNKARREAMAAAFGGANTAEYKTLKDLMSVLQRAAIGKGSQSMTAPFQQIEKELSGAMGSQVYQALKRPKDFMVEKAFEGWNDAMIAGRQGGLMDALMKPDVIKKIKGLKLLKPGSKKLIRGITDAFALITPKLGSDADPDYEGMTDTELMNLLGITQAK